MPRAAAAGWARLAAIVGLVAAQAVGPAVAGDATRLSPDEVRRIVALGPWPLPLPADPSNRLAGNAQAAALGRALFSDVRLSRFGVLSCAACHKPERAWTDGRATASVAVGLDRNTPSLLDVGYATWFGWDGAADSLWAQSIRPILDKREMAATPESVKAFLTGDEALAAGYEATVGAPVAAHAADLVLVNVAKSLAAFQAGLVSARTPFDAFRDALASGLGTSGLADTSAGLPEPALRGLRLFIGEAGCSRCHAGPRLTDGRFYAAAAGATQNQRRIDRGRRDGLARLAASPYRRDGAFSDAPPGVARAEMPDAQALDAGDGPAFRVPTLRGVSRTAPYMHDGSRTTLAGAVVHAVEARPLEPGEIADLVAFLESLSPIEPAP